MSHAPSPAEAARLAPEFQRRGVQMIGLSCNELGSHSKWIEDINKFGSVDVQFPIIADPSREVAKLYDMLDEQVCRSRPSPACGSLPRR